MVERTLSSIVAEKFVIFIKRDDEGIHSPQDLLEAVEALPEDVEIVDGAGKRTITIMLSRQESLRAAQAIEFAKVEPYWSLKLL